MHSLNLNISDNLPEKRIISNNKNTSIPCLIPQHVAIIMDGNGRWAKQRNLPRAAGHKRGVETVRQITELCVELGIRYLTLYTFSTENWKRPKDEISILMKLIVQSLKKETTLLNKNNIKLTTIGNRDLLPDPVVKELETALKTTENNTGLTLNLALSYSGRWDILNAVNAIVRENSGKTDFSESITEELFAEHLATKGIPDPDLLIRTSGELRISNFLLWQIAYSEIFVTNTLWPDFDKNSFMEAINEYQKRERRFGLVSEQLIK